MLSSKTPASFTADPLAHYAAVRARLADASRCSTIVDNGIISHGEQTRIDRERERQSAIAADAVKAAAREAERAERKALFIDRLDEAKKLTSIGTVKLTQAVVAREFGVSIEQLLHGGRIRRFVGPRHVAIYLSRKLTIRSLPEIGRLFGIDHSSAINAIQRVDTLRAADALLSDKIDLLERMITGDARGRVDARDGGEAENVLGHSEDGVHAHSDGNQ